MSNALETETCSRCGGSGSYSYCMTHGSRCFKCNGHKAVYTKRGAAALKYLTELRSKRADQLVVGDIIRVDGMGLSRSGFSAITEIKAYDSSRNSSFVNGVLVPQRTDCMTINTRLMGYDGIPPEQLFRVAQTEDQKAATLAQALEYQSTLTKSGTPRKRGAK